MNSPAVREKGLRQVFRQGQTKLLDKVEQSDDRHARDMIIKTFSWKEEINDEKTQQNAAARTGQFPGVE